jgi:hypothetical protein
LKVPTSGPLSSVHLRVTADLLNSREVEKLIQILEANKDLIDDGAEDAGPALAHPVIATADTEVDRGENQNG